MSFSFWPLCFVWDSTVVLYCSVLEVVSFSVLWIITCGFGLHTVVVFQVFLLVTYVISRSNNKNKMIIVLSGE